MKRLSALFAALMVAVLVSSAASAQDVQSAQGVQDMRGRSVGAKEIERALVVVPSATGAVPAQPAGIIIDIQFGLNSANLTTSARRNLDLVAQAMLSQQLYGAGFALQGHTDLSGPFDYNVQLSQARADAVRAYLASRGVEWSRLQSAGFGPTQLLQGLSPYDSRHRRVEILRIN